MDTKHDGRMRAWNPTVLAATAAAAVLVLLHARRRRLRAAWVASVRITRGSIDDARGRSLAPLVEECFPGTMAECAPGEDTVDQLCGFYDPADCIALFADDDEGLCGLALVFPVRSARESSLYISAVCVRASCQRRGLGGRIMRTASTVAAEEGLATLAGSVQASEQQRCVPHHCTPLLRPRPARPALRPHVWRVGGVTGSCPSTRGSAAPCGLTTQWRAAAQHSSCSAWRHLRSSSSSR